LALTVKVSSRRQRPQIATGVLLCQERLVELIVSLQDAQQPKVLGQQSTVMEILSLVDWVMIACPGGEQAHSKVLAAAGVHQVAVDESVGSTLTLGVV